MSNSYIDIITKISEQYESKYYNDERKSKLLLKNKYSKTKYKKNKVISIARKKEIFYKYYDKYQSIQNKVDKAFEIDKYSEEYYEEVVRVNEDIYSLRKFVINYLKTLLSYDDILLKKLILSCKRKSWFNCKFIKYWDDNNICIDTISYDNGTNYHGIIIKNIHGNPKKFPLWFGCITYPNKDNIIKQWRGEVKSQFDFSYDDNDGDLYFDPIRGNNMATNDYCKNGILSEMHYDDFELK